MASASGTPVPAIARLVAAHEDTVRDVIHRFNEIGLRALDPNWAGGRPRRISADDERHIVATATARPRKLGRPFTHWSLTNVPASAANANNAGPTTAKGSLTASPGDVCGQRTSNPARYGRTISMGGAGAAATSRLWCSTGGSRRPAFVVTLPPK